MAVRITHRDPSDYFYLGFPGEEHEVFVGDRIVLAPWLLDGLRLAELRDVALRLRRRYERWDGSPEWATDDDGALFQVVDLPSEELWDLDEDLPILVRVELAAGRLGVRARAFATAPSESIASESRT